MGRLIFSHLFFSLYYPAMIISFFSQKNEVVQGNQGTDTTVRKGVTLPCMTICRIFTGKAKGMTGIQVMPMVKG